MMPPSSSSAPIGALLLRRYLDRTCAPGESDAVERWMYAHPLGAALVDELRGAPRDARGQFTERDVDALWATIHARRQDAEVAERRHMSHESRARDRMPTRPSSHGIARHHGLARAMRRALGVVALAATGAAVFMALRGANARRAASAISEGRVYTTAAGQRTTLALPDGSHVTLAPGSRLAVSQDFGSAARLVTLSGQAFFDVARATGAPFIVRTGTVDTRVLGTRFDVRRYADDRVTRVAVVSGKVASGGVRTPVTLTAGTMAVVTDSSASSTVVNDMTEFTGWTTGRLVFKDARVTDLLATVGRWYGYRFALADSSLATRHVSTVLVMHESSETMQALQILLDVTMTFDKDVITLHPRKPTSAPARPSQVSGRAFLPSFSEVGK